MQYRDGLRATLLNLGGYVSDFCFAARVGGQVVASAFKLQGSPPRWHFNFLTHHIEQFFRSGQAPYPVERTLLTTGTLAALMELRGGRAPAGDAAPGRALCGAGGRGAHGGGDVAARGSGLGLQAGRRVTAGAAALRSAFWPALRRSRNSAVRSWRSRM